MSLNNISVPLAGEAGVLVPSQNNTLPERTENSEDAIRKQRHREYNREYNRIWAQKNPERIKAIRKREHQKNRVAYLARAKKHSKTEKCKNRTKKYLKQYLPKYLEKNRERLNARSKAYSRAHPEATRRKRKKWQKNHPELWRAHLKAGRVKRKARMRGADVGCKEVSPLIRRWKLNTTFECYWCNRNFSTKMLCIDHIKPIARGGKHEASNVCRSCRDCNSRKKDHLQTDPDYKGQMILLWCMSPSYMYSP